MYVNILNVTNSWYHLHTHCKWHILSILIFKTSLKRQKNSEKIHIVTLITLLFLSLVTVAFSMFHSHLIIKSTCTVMSSAVSFPTFLFFFFYSTIWLFYYCVYLMIEEVNELPYFSLRILFCFLPFYLNWKNCPMLVFLSRLK